MRALGILLSAALVAVIVTFGTLFVVAQSDRGRMAVLDLCSGVPDGGLRLSCFDAAYALSKRVAAPDESTDPPSD